MAARRAREATLVQKHEMETAVVAPLVEPHHEATSQTSRKRKRSEGRLQARSAVEEGIPDVSTKLHVTGSSKAHESLEPRSQAVILPVDHEDMPFPSRERSPVVRTGPEGLRGGVSGSNGHRNSFAFRRSFSIVVSVESDTNTPIVSEKAEQCTVKLGEADVSGHTWNTELSNCKTRL